MVTQSTLNKTAQFYESILSHGRYRVGSTYHVIPIHNIAVVDNVIQVFLLVDHSFAGTINRFQLFDNDGDLFAQRNDSLSKTAEQGILVRFTIQIREV